MINHMPGEGAFGGAHLPYFGHHGFYGQHMPAAMGTAMGPHHMYDQYEKSLRDWTPAVQELNRLRGNMGAFQKLEWSHKLASEITDADFLLPHPRKFPQVVVKAPGIHPLEHEKQHVVKKGVAHLFEQMVLHEHMKCMVNGECKAGHLETHEFPWAVSFIVSGGYS
jgi:hypothetical protein